MSRFLAILAAMLLVTGGASFAQPLIPNTINCQVWKKQTDPAGWFVGAPTTFAIGEAKALTFANSLITPGIFGIGDTDLYDVLEQKCGRR